MAIEVATDAELVQRASRGDISAFNMLVRKWEKPLYNFALRLTGHREDALDLAQEAFMKAFRQLRQLQSRNKFSSWLFKIALNLFYTAKRSGRDGQTVSLDDEAGDGLSLVDALSAAPLLQKSGFDAVALDRERTRRVRQAILALQQDQRVAVILKIYYGMKFEEIAEIVDCPVSTVKSRLYAAMENLQEVLRPWVEGPG
jgi:RNA polymerase sigma-70 factor (ECF subfamily)